MNKNSESLNGTIDSPFVPPLAGNLTGTLDVAPLAVPEALSTPAEIPQELKPEGPEQKVKPLRGEVSGVTEMPGWDKAHEFTETAQDRHLRELITDGEGAAKHSLEGSLTPEVTVNDGEFNSRQGKLAISANDDLPSFLRSGSEASDTSSQKRVELDDDIPPFLRTVQPSGTLKPVPAPEAPVSDDKPESFQGSLTIPSDDEVKLPPFLRPNAASQPTPETPNNTPVLAAPEPAPNPLPETDDFDYLADPVPAGDTDSKYTIATAPWREGNFRHYHTGLDIRNLPEDFFDGMTLEEQKAWSEEMKAIHPKAGVQAPARDETDYSIGPHGITQALREADEKVYGKKMSWREKLAAGRNLAAAGINAVLSHPAADAAADKLEEGWGKAKGKLAEGTVAAMDGFKFVTAKMREAMTEQTKKIAQTEFGEKYFTKEGKLTSEGTKATAIGVAAVGGVILGVRAFLKYKYLVDLPYGTAFGWNSQATETAANQTGQTTYNSHPDIPKIVPTPTDEAQFSPTTTPSPTETTMPPQTTTEPIETSAPKPPVQPLPDQAPLSKGPDLIDQPNTFERPATIQLAEGETVWGRLQNMMPPNATNQDMVNELVRFFEANKLPIDWNSDDPFGAARSLTSSQVLTVPK